MPPQGHRSGRRGRRVRDPVIPNSSGDTGLDEYKLKVKDFTTVGPDSNIETTQHEPGGRGTGYVGTWIRGVELGRGGFGRVYLEKNNSTQKLRAVKQLIGAGQISQNREMKCMVMIKKVNQ